MPSALPSFIGPASRPKWTPGAVPCKGQVPTTSEVPLMPRSSRLLLDMLELDRTADLPLHRQLYNSLRSHVLDGRLPPRTRLPATRVLANDLGVSRNTVIAAYDALLAEGYLDSVAGSGTRVAMLPAPPARRRAERDTPELPQLSARGALMTTQPRDRTIPGRIAFHPGYPEIASFPFSTWSRRE